MTIYLSDKDLKKKKILQQAREFLLARGFGKEEAEREILLIFSHLLGCRPLEVYFVPEKELEAVEGDFWSLLKRRARGIPLAYVLGKIEFYGRTFKVGPGVLIPRPETEILVEVVLRLFKEEARLLELGVGSGCVSLTLALENPLLKIFGVEKSLRALGYACLNRKKLGLADRVYLIGGDWFSPIKEKPLFQAVISNPPYIAPEEWEELSPEVKYHEPPEALLAEEEGLFYITKTLEEAPKFLFPGGLVILEIGFNQKERVASLAQSLGYQYRFEKDLLGYERVLVAQKANRK